MARASAIQRSRAKATTTALPFVPEVLQAFIARRLVDTVSLTTLAGGLFILVALASYSHADPSWNTATGTPSENVGNWAGLPGAWVADALLQTLGVAACIPGLVLTVWGARMFRRQSIKPLWARLVTLMAATLLTAISLAPVPSGGWMVHAYLGSSAGTLLFSPLEQFASAFVPGYAALLIAVSTGFLAACSGLYAAAVNQQELQAGWRNLRYAAMVTASAIAATFAMFRGWISHYNDPDHFERPSLPSASGFLDRIRAMMPEKQALRLEEEETPAAPRSRSRKQPVIAAQTTTPAATLLSATRTAPQKEESFAKSRIPVVANGKGQQEKEKAKPPTQQPLTFDNADEDWELPPLTLLQEAPVEGNLGQLDEAALRRNAELLHNVLNDFNVQGEIVSIHPGPVVTLYELEPAPGTKTSRVISLSDDIARSMSAVSVRCAVVPGRNVIGIELPNKKRQTVYMQELLASRLYEKTKAHLPLILGKDIGGEHILADLAKMPHLLVAGTTGSGKSVAVNTMILSLLCRLSPRQCRFIMIDPKMLELSVYDGIPHLLSPVVTEPGKAVVALKWAVKEMEDRYRAMSKLGVRNIEGYNNRIAEALKKGEVLMHKVQTGYDADTGKPIYEEQPMPLSELPFIVVVVDEFADLMLVAGKDVESAIQRLAQMARAAGIHLIMATQRPSVDVITGVIKANFPTRISFQVTSKIDSRTILGEGGAEQLLGMGDMLYMAPGGRITRVHGPFVSDKDVENVVTFLKSQGEPIYIDSITSGEGFGDNEIMGALFGGGEGGGGNSVDEMYDHAVALVAREGKASTSFIQRYLQIGYNRAARIIEEMERQGVVSKANAVGKREVLVNRDFSDM